MGLRLVRSKSANSYKGFNPYWYAQMRVNGKLKDFPLSTKITGTPPLSGKVSDKGDDAFEQSREKALKELEKNLSTKHSTKNAESAVRLVYEERTGRKYDEDFPPLNELGLRVTQDGGDERWMQYVRSIFDNFAAFAAKENRKLMVEIDTAFAREYAKHLVKQNFKWETIKKNLSRLASAFDEFLPSGFKNPFKGIVKATKRANRTMDTAPTKRKPLTDDELASLFVEARKMGDDIYNLTACAVNTGMRLKDICLLKWEDVDLRRGLIRCKTHKTGARVTIGIINELTDVLDGANTDATGRDPVYVFPAIAEKYEQNQTGIVRDGKVLFARALAAIHASPLPDEADVPELTDDERHAKIIAVINSARWIEAKRERIRNVFALYRNGLSYRDIESKTGISRRCISMDFAEVERLAGVSFRKGNRNGIKGPSEQTLIETYTREKSSTGKCNLSIYSWHSLRNNFVVRAINAGVSSASIQKIVGHSTFKQTLDYYNPTEEIAAAEMKLKMDRKFKGHPASDKVSAVLQMFSSMTPEDRASFISLTRLNGQSGIT